MLTSERALETLRASGLRLTPQRRALIDILADNTAHPSADDIYRDLADRMPGISLTTVYKALHEFAELGLVRELDTPGAMRFDPDVSDHAHLVCAGCGAVVDIPLAPDAAAAFTPPPGVRVDSVDITLHGICGVCSTDRAQ